MKKTLTVHIDNKKIIADEGTTILEAARQNNIYIPTLCYHPRLEPMGHCRMCIVEIEGMKRPVTSCDNPVVDGMVVKTDSSRLREMRSQILELSLSTHPYEDCLTCVRTGSCELQQKAYECQVNLPVQLDRTIPSGETADNRDIIRDEEKCILCGRCIQVCRSGPGRFVYSLIGNGVNTRVAPVKDGNVVSLEEAGCIFCGQCVDLCPVAALTEVGRSDGGREWELLNMPGICNECSLACYLERYSSDGELIRVTVPREGDKISWLCVKGRFGFKDTAAAENIKSPLKRSGNKYNEIKYEEAVKETAENIKKVIDTTGPDSLAVLASGKLSNEENYLLQKLARTVINTPYINLGAESAWVNAYTEAMAITGANVTGPTPAAIGYASAVTIIGGDLEESHPVAAMVVDRAGRFGDAVIIRIGDDTAETSAWKEINLKTDNNDTGTVLRAMTTAIAGSESADESATLGIPAGTLAEAAQAVTGNNSITVVAPSFFKEAESDAIKDLIKFLEVAGHLQKGHSRVLMLSSFSNSLGVLLTGGTSNYGPGITKISENISFDSRDLMKSAKSGKIKALITFGEGCYAFNLKDINFTLAVSSTVNGAPPEADIVIPAQQLHHKNGYFTNSQGQTRINRSVAGENKDIKSDWRLICDIANALGSRWNFGSIEEVRLEMKSVTPAE